MPLATCLKNRPASSRPPTTARSSVKSLAEKSDAVGAGLGAVWSDAEGYFRSPQLGMERHPKKQVSTGATFRYFSRLAGAVWVSSLVTRARGPSSPIQEMSSRRWRQTVWDERRGAVDPTTDKAL